LFGRRKLTILKFFFPQPKPAKNIGRSLRRDAVPAMAMVSVISRRGFLRADGFIRSGIAELVAS
jgi:hypothetical protein